MEKRLLKKIIPIFEKYPEVKLVYFFGSQAAEEAGPASDFDFAVYLDEKNRQKMFDVKFSLMDRLSCALQTDKIDIIILNATESPEIKYQIIKEGKLIYEKEPFRILVEPRILQDYFDFHHLLIRHNLTKSNTRL